MAKPSTPQALERSGGDSRVVISLYHVDLCFGAYKALDDISFQVENGEFVFLVGPSGAGKSSILRLITMDDFATKGEVVVGRFVSSRMKRKQVPKLRRDMGMVFQDFRLLDDRSVEENVAFAQLVIGESRAAIKRNVSHALNAVGLHHKRTQNVHTLSGGERQRVAIARAIVNRPKILLADEPTGNLDPEVTQEVIDLLFRINEGGTAVVMSTHDHVMVRQYGERIISVKDGKMVSDLERRGYRADTSSKVIAATKLSEADDGFQRRQKKSWAQPDDFMSPRPQGKEPADV